MGNYRPYLTKIETNIMTITIRSQRGNAMKKLINVSLGGGG